MWKHLVKIQNSQLLIIQMYPSINRNYGEKFNKLSRWLNRLSIPIQSIEKANSIYQKEFRSVENWINSSQSLKLTRSILNSRSIDRKGTFDRSKLAKTHHNGFSWTNYHHMNIIDWVWDQKMNFIDTIALKFNLTYLISNLNNIITSISIFILQ